MDRTDIILHGGTTGEFSRGLFHRGLVKALETHTFIVGALLSIMGGLFTRNSER